jgi:hypothetical protein
MAVSMDLNQRAAIGRKVRTKMDCIARRHTHNPGVWAGAARLLQTFGKSVLSLTRLAKIRRAPIGGQRLPAEVNGLMIAKRRAPGSAVNRVR